MEWVAVEGKPQTRSRSKPVVTVSKAGMIGFNAAALKTSIGEILGERKTRAAILYSQKQKLMAVLPVAEDEVAKVSEKMVKLGVVKNKPRFYTLRVLKNRRTIPAKSAFKECGIPLPAKAITSEPKIDEFPELGPIITFSVEALFSQEKTGRHESALNEAAAASE